MDILALGLHQELVAIEVKREAAMPTVGQVLRYVEALKEGHPEAEGRRPAAVSFKDSTLRLAEKSGVQCLKVPEDEQVLIHAHSSEGPEAVREAV